jgi:hypothetical protein
MINCVQRLLACWARAARCVLGRPVDLIWAAAGDYDQALQVISELGSESPIDRHQS